MNKSLKLNSNLPLLHAIRGIAALYVVVFHAKFILWSGGREYLAQYPRASWGIADYFLFSIDMLFSAGSQMVMIFFVLSGFFIAMSFENIKGSISEKLKYFYSVRFIRIYMPYVASMLIGIFVLIVVADVAPNLYYINSPREFNSRLLIANVDITVSNFAKGLVFDKNQEYIGFNYAYWSLLYEGIFYLIVPFVFRFKKIYLAASAVLFMAGMYMVNVLHVQGAALRFIFEYNFYFAIGQAIYMYREQLSKYAMMKYYKLMAVVGCIGLFLCFNVLALVQLEFWANFLAAMAAVLLIVLFLNYDVKNSFAVKMVKKLGEMSYSLYLIHVPTLIFVYALIYNYTGQTVFFQHIYFIGVLASLCTGWAFYRLVEMPSLSLIKKLKQFFKYRSVSRYVGAQA